MTFTHSTKTDLRTDINSNQPPTKLHTVQTVKFHWSLNPKTLYLHNISPSQDEISIISIPGVLLIINQLNQLNNAVIKSDIYHSEIK